jgi:hypothetical protein
LLADEPSSATNSAVLGVDGRGARHFLSERLTPENGPLSGVRVKFPEISADRVWWKSFGTFKRLAFRNHPPEHLYVGFVNAPLFYVSTLRLRTSDDRNPGP